MPSFRSFDSASGEIPWPQAQQAASGAVACGLNAASAAPEGSFLASVSADRDLLLQLAAEMASSGIGGRGHPGNIESDSILPSAYTVSGGAMALDASEATLAGDSPLTADQTAGLGLHGVIGNNVPTLLNSAAGWEPAANWHRSSDKMMNADRSCGQVAQVPVCLPAAAMNPAFGEPPALPPQQDDTFPSSSGAAATTIEVACPSRSADLLPDSLLECELSDVVPVNWLVW